MAWVLCVTMATSLALPARAQQAQQESALAEARQLDAQAQRGLAAGKAADAIALAQRALEIRERALGPDHPEVAASLTTLGMAHRAAGAFTRAEPLYRRALSIHERTSGADHVQAAAAQGNLAELYRSMGQYGRAEPLHRAALATRERLLGPGHPDTGTSLNDLGLLLDATARYAEAEPLLRRALAISEQAKGAAHPDTATALGNLAWLYSGTGELTRAEPLFRRALAIREQVLGPAHPATGSALRSLARLHQDLGEPARAEPLYRRALAVSEQALGPDHPGTATALSGLAGLYVVTGAQARAAPLFERALAIRERALGPEHPDTISAQMNLALALRSDASHQRAESLYRQALATSEKVLGPDHPRTAAAAASLAELYRSTGAHEQALPLYRRALAINEKVLGSEHRQTAGVLNNMGLLLADIGQRQEADLVLARALAIRERALGPDHPSVADTLGGLAVLRWSSGNLAGALPLLRQAQHTAELNTARFLLAGSEAHKRAYLQRGQWATYANVSFSLAMSDAAARELGLDAVLQHKGRALDAMADGAARLRRSAAPADLALLDELSSVAREQSSLAFGPAEGRNDGSRRDRQVALARRQDELQAELAARSVALGAAVAPVSLDAVRKALPAGAVLVEWFRYRPYDPAAVDVRSRWGASRYVAYAQRRDGEAAAVDLGRAADIDRLAREFRAALGDPRSQQHVALARALYRRLVAPLGVAIGDRAQLLIAPDGELNLVPFAALMADDGRYLAQRHEITYLTSGRDLMGLASSPGAQGEATVFADPAFGAAAGPAPPADRRRAADLDRSGIVFAPLPGTADEARALQKLLQLPSAHLLTGAQASEERLKALRRPRLLHVATHGFFLGDDDLAALQGAGAGPPESPLAGAGAGAVTAGENPLLRSGLALAGANARRSGLEGDGILTAAEVAELDLLGTRLVVLSACQTGEGQLLQGEGVYGLRRALVLAGAQAQLVSLWNVADDPTADLMVRFYERLLRGDGRSAALRRVQLEMMARPATAHPYFWAPFVLIGAWGPL